MARRSGAAARFSARGGAWPTATSPTGRSGRSCESTWESWRANRRRRCAGGSASGRSSGSLSGSTSPAARTLLPSATASRRRGSSSSASSRRKRRRFVLVEDLHWAEDPLLDLLERVCREVRGPLLVIGTARPELLDRRRSWGGGRRNASLVWLDALSPGESAAMLDELVPGELSDGTRRALVERAEGNPVLSRGAAGCLRRDRCGRGAAGLGPGDPLGARRPARERRQGGAPGGVGDRSRLLERADPGARRWGAGRLDGPRGPRTSSAAGRRSSIGGETEYVFKHALTREVVYGSVPKARRARLHAAHRRLARADGRWARRGRGSARPPLRTGCRSRRRRSRLGGRAGGARATARARRALAPPRRGARDQALRPRRGPRRSAACARALRAARAPRALARDRPRERAQVRRRALLGGDEVAR